jgi:hypothetical protein
VTFIGNSGTNIPNCSQMIGYAIDFSGNSNLNIAGCAAQHVARAQTTRLAQ